LLNVAGFYDPLLRLLDHMRGEGFLTPEHHGLLTIEDNVDRLLDRLVATKHKAIPKPIHRTTNVRP
jgi:predicted Rossmann-fold nucleotide-binding protein